MLTNDVGTCSWLVDELVASRIADRERLEPYLAGFVAEFPYADADAFAKHLTREKVISRYQAKRAIDGDAKKLVLGAYVLVEVIGNGSLGPVFLALGRADRKPYAVKVLPQRSWNVRLARHQVRAFQDLPDHDGFATFLDVGTAHGLHYLVWPFVAGRTLEALVPECGPLTPGEAARIGVQIALVLEDCHAHGLIHGLIKPSNVVIGPDGHSRLLDYGIGALLAENPEDDPMLDTMTRANSMAHLLECTAPESIVNSAKWTPVADQYSLGCTLYFVATGRYPFPGGTFLDKIVNHQTNKPTPIRSLNPDVPLHLADAIERLMQKSPGDRYRNIDELLRELEPLATVSCVRPPVPVNVETPPPQARLQIKTASEPPILQPPPETPKRGFLGRMFGGR